MKIAVIAAGAVIAVGGLVLDCLRAVTLSSSSLSGRLAVLHRRGENAPPPLWVWAMAATSTSSLEQAGVYTLRFIHNGYFQAALDGSIPAGLCLMGLCAAMLFRKGTSSWERTVVLAVAAYACINFALQFSAAAFLLLCGSGGRCREIPVRRQRISAALCSAGALALGCFSPAYALDFFSRPAMVESKYQPTATVGKVY